MTKALIDKICTCSAVRHLEHCGVARASRVVSGTGVEGAADTSTSIDGNKCEVFRSVDCNQRYRAVGGLMTRRCTELLAVEVKRISDRSVGRTPNSPPEAKRPAPADRLSR